MRNFDFTPLWRSTVGFDRLFDLIDESLTLTDEDNYPPYNIERTGEDSYRVTFALAGFKPDEISVTAEQNTFTVEGRKADKGDRGYLYQGIAGRPFSRQFTLADYVEVEERIVREWAAAHRPGTGAAGSHEAAPDRGQVRRCRPRQPANRARSGGLSGSAAAGLIGFPAHGFAARRELTKEV